MERHTFSLRGKGGGRTPCACHANDRNRSRDESRRGPPDRAARAQRRARRAHHRARHPSGRLELEGHCPRPGDGRCAAADHHGTEQPGEGPDRCGVAERPGDLPGRARGRGAHLLPLADRRWRQDLLAGVRAHRHRRAGDLPGRAPPRQRRCHPEPAGLDAADRPRVRPPRPRHGDHGGPDRAALRPGGRGTDRGPARHGRPLRAGRRGRTPGGGRRRPRRGRPDPVRDQPARRARRLPPVRCAGLGPDAARAGRDPPVGQPPHVLRHLVRVAARRDGDDGRPGRRGPALQHGDGPAPALDRRQHQGRRRPQRSRPGGGGHGPGGPRTPPRDHRDRGAGSPPRPA